MFVQFQQELFVPFQTGVTWQWQALTDDKRHQNITIKPRLNQSHFSALSGSAPGSDSLKWHTYSREMIESFGEGMTGECVCASVCISDLLLHVDKQPHPYYLPLPLSLSLSEGEQRQGLPTTRSNRDLFPYQLDQTAACQRKARQKEGGMHG